MRLDSLTARAWCRAAEEVAWAERLLETSRRIGVFREWHRNALAHTRSVLDRIEARARREGSRHG